MTPASAREELLTGSYGLSVIETALSDLDGHLDTHAAFYRINPEMRDLDLQALMALATIRDELKARIVPAASRMSNRLRDEEEDLAA